MGGAPASLHELQGFYTSHGPCMDHLLNMHASQDIPTASTTIQEAPRTTGRCPAATMLGYHLPHGRHLCHPHRPRCHAHAACPNACCAHPPKPGSTTYNEQLWQCSQNKKIQWRSPLSLMPHRPPYPNPITLRACPSLSPCSPCRSTRAGQCLLVHDTMPITPAHLSVIPGYSLYRRLCTLRATLHAPHHIPWLHHVPKAPQRCARPPMMPLNDAPRDRPHPDMHPAPPRHVSGPTTHLAALPTCPNPQHIPHGPMHVRRPPQMHLDVYITFVGLMVASQVSLAVDARLCSTDTDSDSSIRSSSAYGSQ